jgi:hypothetical protein
MKSKLPISLDRLIFREVCIGGMSKSKLLKKLNENKVGLNEFALKYINHNEFTISSSKEKLQTVEISVSDLGFLNGATIHEICQKAHEFGFRICPHELGIHMRLQYIDLSQPVDPPKGNWQNIIVQGLLGEPGFTQGFYLRRREDGFWLRGYRASLDYLWDPTDRFIFVLDLQ